jgi:alpha-D-ribose 1-methylphosphonate 5-triphosphate synthase subunit PhnL
MLGIFHDEDVRERVADRQLPLEAHLLRASDASTAVNDDTQEPLR